MTETATDAPEAADTPKRKLPRWRRVLVSVLVVAACVFAPISVMGVWIHNTLLNTDQYVATVGPLASNSAVQNALATRISNTLVTGSGLETKIKDALPPKASFVAPFLSNGIGQFVDNVALKIVQAPKFAQLWNTLNRRAHAEIVSVLKGGRSKVSTKNGQVAINIGPIVDQVNAKLKQLGIDQLPNKSGQIVLFSSSGLHQAQGAVKAFDALRIALPIITLLLFAGAIALSGNRRRTVLRSALGLALAMGLLLTVFNLARSIYLDALPASVNQAAAGAVYDQLLTFLRDTLRVVFLVAIIIALGAWLAGPGRYATRIRTASRDLVRRTPGQSVVAPSVATFVDRYRKALQIVVVGVGLAILVVLNHPGPVAVLVIALVVLLLVGVIELLARGAPAASAAPSSRT